MTKWVFGFFVLAAVLLAVQAALDNAKVKRIQKSRDAKIFPDSKCLRVAFCVD